MPGLLNPSGVWKSRREEGAKPQAAPRRASTLSELRPGEEGEVEALCCQVRERLRLLEMGVTPGTHVRVLRAAAFGGPLEVLVRGYQLSLRREEASCIYLRG